MKAAIGRSAIIAFVFLAGLIVFSAQTSIAETLLSQFQPETKETKAAGKLEAAAPAAQPAKDLVPAANYLATAYSLKGKTASGRMVSRGLIAADPAVLPLGSRVRVEHPGYSGEYLVADTGGKIRGRRIDIWTPSSHEAMRFGKRTVKLTVLSYGSRRTKAAKRTTSKG
jgi:3D (Asp-Asp-Asp) domain-containing protein